MRAAGCQARAAWGGDVAAERASITGMQVPTSLLIGGEWTDGQAGVLPVVDPATEDPIAEVANESVEDALEAVTAAYDALPRWAATPPRERGECLRRAWELMIQRSDALARVMVLENGTALKDAKSEITYAAEFFRWYAEEAVRNDGSLVTAPSGANRIMVQHQPVGVSVLVTPWNFPAAMATRKIGPALAAGCTGVLEAGKGDAAVGVRRRRDPARGRRTGRGRERAHHGQGRPARSRHAGGPPGPQAVLHRLHRGWPVAAGDRGADHYQLLDGTRRQRAVPGVRRRGPRRCPGRRVPGQDAQRRRGVHRSEPVLRARGGRGRVQLPVRQAAGRPQGRPRPGRRHRAGPAGPRGDQDQGGRSGR